MPPDQVIDNAGGSIEWLNGQEHLSWLAEAQRPAALLPGTEVVNRNWRGTESGAEVV